ncbi:hypothetical protein ACWENQ_15780 [Nonomuraea sp. NPDC004354]
MAAAGPHRPRLGARSDNSEQIELAATKRRIAELQTSLLMLWLRRPRAELVGVADGPDELDPVACHLERLHGYGEAILLGDQAGLAVDRTIQDRQVAEFTLEMDQGAHDLLGAFDWAERGADQAAAVAEFMRATATGDLEELLWLLAPEVTWTADSGGMALGPGRRAPDAMVWQWSTRPVVDQVDT